MPTLFQVQYSNTYIHSLIKKTIIIRYFIHLCIPRLRYERRKCKKNKKKIWKDIEIDENNSWQLFETYKNVLLYTQTPFHMFLCELHVSCFFFFCNVSVKLLSGMGKIDPHLYIYEAIQTFSFKLNTYRCLV